MKPQLILKWVKLVQKNHIIVRTVLKNKLAQEFESLKEKKGLSQNSELMRLIIREAYLCSLNEEQVESVEVEARI